MNDSRNTFLSRFLSAGICVMMLAIFVVTTVKAGDRTSGDDGHTIQVEKTENGCYENVTYQWINETECEPVKVFRETETEDGVSVHIVSYRDGEKRVLMDCQYDKSRFPYYFERCSDYAKNIFFDFYSDNPVWEKTVRVKNGQAYTLYYAQEIQHDSEEQETVTGYEGHLWVTDESTKIVKRLFWQSEAPYTKITWDKSGLYIKYADGIERVCTISEIEKDPVEAICEECMQIDYEVKENPVDGKNYDAVMDRKYREAFYRVISGQDRVRTSEGEEVYLKSYWIFQGDPDMKDEVFLKNLIENTRFYYMDFDGDGLPELVMDIIGDGLHVLQYLPDEEVVRIFFGYERMPYYHLLGSGQLYYKNGMQANKLMWRYDTVDAHGQVRQIVSFMEDADYKPYKEDEEIWWDMAYWVYLDEELGMIQVSEEQYLRITERFLGAVEHAVPAQTYEEIFAAL